MNLEIRKFDIADIATILDLMDLNIPKYFAASEKDDLLGYLNSEIEDYFVITCDNKLIGAGGINYEHEQAIAKISWDIIHPDYQGKGVGRQLLTYRIDYINLNYSTYNLIVRTSQLVFKFYEQHGFTLEYIKKDYWAVGFDLYYMIYK